METNQQIPVTPTTLPEPQSLTEVLERIDAWYKKYLPDVQATLRPGATDADLDALEKQIGLPLPADFRALYRWHDGQNWSVGGVLGLDFAPLDQIAADLTVWTDIAEDNDLAMNVMIYTVSHPTGAIREQYASPLWVPFLNDGGGNHVALDLGPDVAGKSGQIITTGRDETHRFVLAPNTETFLRTYLSRLESGRVKVEKLKGFDHDMWRDSLTDANGYSDGGGFEFMYPGFGATPTVIERSAVSDTEPLQLPEALSRIDAWLKAHQPDLFAALGSGASAAELTAAEQRLGHALPEAAKLLYSQHRDWGLVFGPRFIPLEQLGSQDPATFGAPDAKETVKPYVQSAPPSTAADWLPLWQDEQGDYIGINTVHYGEIHTFGPHIRPRVVLAENLNRLLDRYVRFMEAGLLRRQGQQLLMPDAHGGFEVKGIEGYFPSAGLSPAVR